MDPLDDEGDLDDREALVPHSHTILGLKVADQEEALTVRRVGGAVLGLALLLAVHFLVHVAHEGHVWHAVMHLGSAALLPTVGYVAVSQRSTKAAWMFHMMAVLASFAHAAMVVVVVATTAEIRHKAQSADCAKFAHDCDGDAADLAGLSFSADRSVWRCGGGWCIAGAARCDNFVNCFDGSDEVACGEASKQYITVHDHDSMKECRFVHAAHSKAPNLQAWWLLMTLPMWVLCVWTAYHSLEFYVQLRVRRLAARVNRHTAEATIFERGDHEVDDE